MTEQVVATCPRAMRRSDRRGPRHSRFPYIEPDHGDGFRQMVRYPRPDEYAISCGPGVEISLV